MFDSKGLEVLPPTECLRLLGQAPIGRIVFTEQALPAVQPVHYALDGDSVVIRTTVGSKLAAAARNSIVAFEVDQIDAGHEVGWSVTVVGHAEMVTEAKEIDRLAGLSLHSWSPAEPTHFIRVRMEMIRGRRLVPHPPAHEAAQEPTQEAAQEPTTGTA
ncbi:Nitroimidazol reductase NimA, pyridoxamine 5'-phosphate oxidase superfamily [Actinopolymorpha cephalotaxi]|uniref:Nitroimidazol reductase NimA, pyridoxamine 5'-phosphate oxidase superfamily n=1 Tax=Actinopolymorpha cephalotaxi TaxID=504797 RepID=A0A1I2VKP5_9ACTN|nr:pyridoxamine 5'-phosphate oxidase family protein [Actinopolymorpha cephalotaxi]NYH83315.1 nitroimidazol reductase NimA-like FMN-containing flavoprotein (pyridoxamine 5'-phosphate oxidase superfamily) [Actinopolymorpha cephalotaxi]SFG88989.1 Nitroimidazol reductase NimA, pyridoxamine 5'-phosphate oxidase superfamily [Actinopolymorpha cephalotaxi]